ncbi:MAG TPA: hypothetical protein VLG38_06385 [Gammaproteobacteria bacterium]|nr:hypothetical protein [Gammaproteobacteria bacterium]
MPSYMSSVAANASENAMAMFSIIRAWLSNVVIDAWQTINSIGTYAVSALSPNALKTMVANMRAIMQSMATSIANSAVVARALQFFARLNAQVSALFAPVFARVPLLATLLRPFAALNSVLGGALQTLLLAATSILALPYVVAAVAGVARFAVSAPWQFVTKGYESLSDYFQSINEELFRGWRRYRSGVSDTWRHTSGTLEGLVSVGSTILQTAVYAALVLTHSVINTAYLVSVLPVKLVADTLSTAYRNASKTVNDVLDFAPFAFIRRPVIALRDTVFGEPGPDLNTRVRDLENLTENQRQWIGYHDRRMSNELAPAINQHAEILNAYRTDMTRVVHNLAMGQDRNLPLPAEIAPAVPTERTAGNQDVPPQSQIAQTVRATVR